MKRKRLTVSRRPRPRSAARRDLTIRLNLADLSEDEIEYLYYLEHRDEPTVPLDEVMRKAGYELER